MVQNEQINIYLIGALGNSGASFMAEILKKSKELNINLILIEKPEVIKNIKTKNIRDVTVKTPAQDDYKLPVSPKDFIDIREALNTAKSSPPNLILSVTNANDLTGEYDNDLGRLQLKSPNSVVLEFSNGIKGPLKAMIKGEKVFGNKINNFANAVINYPSASKLEGNNFIIEYQNENGATNGISISNEDLKKLHPDAIKNIAVIESIGMKVQKPATTAEMAWQKIGQSPLDVLFATGTKFEDVLENAPIQLLTKRHFQTTYEVSMKAVPQNYDWQGKNLGQVFEDILKIMAKKPKTIGSIARAVNQDKQPEIKGFVTDVIKIAKNIGVETPIHKRTEQICNLLVDVYENCGEHGPHYIKALQNAITSHLSIGFIADSAKMDENALTNKLIKKFNNIDLGIQVREHISSFSPYTIGTLFNIIKEHQALWKQGLSKHPYGIEVKG